MHIGSLSRLLAVALLWSSIGAKKRKSSEPPEPCAPAVGWQSSITTFPDDNNEDCTWRHRTNDFEKSHCNTAWFWFGPLNEVTDGITFFDFTSAKTKGVKTQLALYNANGQAIATSNVSVPFLSYGDKEQRSNYTGAGPFKSQNGRLATGQLHLACTVKSSKVKFNGGFQVVDAPKSDKSCTVSYRYCRPKPRP